MSLAAFMQRLRELGTPPEAIEYAVEQLMAERTRAIETEAVSRAEKEALAARRKADADRQWKRRNPGMSRDVTECHRTSQDIQDAAPHQADTVFPSESLVPPSPPKGGSVPQGTGRRRGSRIPDGFEHTDEARKVAADFGLYGDEADEALAEFADYWRPLPGVKATKLDWIGTLRNRLREVARRRPRARGSPHPQPAKPNVAGDRAAFLLSVIHGGNHDASSQDQRFLDSSRTIDHEGYGGPDRDLSRAPGADPGQFQEEGIRRLARSERG